MIFAKRIDPGWKIMLKARVICAERVGPCSISDLFDPDWMT